MKKLFVLLAAVGLLTACGDDAPEVADTPEIENPAEDTPKWGSFGDEITDDGVTPMADFVAAMGTQETWEGKLSTTINECCAKKGCWMKVDLGNGEEMRVTFKDYGFFVPLDAGGKPAIMEGKAYYDTVSVEMLKHFAEDAQKSQEEIDAITEPELTLAFEATGVLIEGAVAPEGDDDHAGHNHGDHDGHDHDGDAHENHDAPDTEDGDGVVDGGGEK